MCRQNLVKVCVADKGRLNKASNHISREARVIGQPRNAGDKSKLEKFSTDGQTLQELRMLSHVSLLKLSSGGDQSRRKKSSRSINQEIARSARSEGMGLSG